MAESKKPKTTKSTAKGTDKKPNWGIIGAIIAIVVVIIIGIIVAVCMLNGKKDDKDDAGNETGKTEETTLVAETGKGEKINMEYVHLDGTKFYVQVPADFRKLSAAEIAESYSDEELTTVYSDKDNTVNIALSASDTEIKNSDIEEYLDVMKEYMAEYSEVVGSKLYKVGNYNIGSLEIISEEIYNHMIFFSYNNGLAIVTFNCEEDLRDEWETVGDYIIDSLKFEE